MKKASPYDHKRSIITTDIYNPIMNGGGTPGKVYLVGAGPGDPELLTRKALRLLQSASLVLHDDLVAPEILELISTGVAIQNVGKRYGRKSMTQEEIHARMIDAAHRGHVVVRLKGGDPMIYGRAGEELEALRAAGVEVEVVPGVTSALAAAAAAQVPLTDRRYAPSVTFLSGHRCAAGGAAGFESAPSKSTAVVYMPGNNPTEIAGQLEAAGMAPATPCLIVSAASTPRQQIFHLTLQDLFAAPRYPSPAILIVGQVAVSRSNEKSANASPKLKANLEINLEQNEKVNSEKIEEVHSEKTGQLNVMPVWQQLLRNFAEAWYG